MRLLQSSPLLLLLSLVCGCWCQSDLQYQQVMDDEGKFLLSWTPRQILGTIEMEMTVESLAWVAIGLSPNGMMSGSDVAMGGVRDGEPYFWDMFAEGHSPPPVDDSQDWTLISASENDTHTTVRFTRSLVTGDPMDMDITDTDMNVIYAYGPVDPPVDGEPSYHGNDQRGGVVINLLNPAKTTKTLNPVQTHFKSKQAAALRAMKQKQQEQKRGDMDCVMRP